MRVIFCGSGPFAVPALRALLETTHEVVRIVTQPPRPAGRGGKLRHTPVAEMASELGLEVCACQNINEPEAVAQMTADEADAMVVVDFGQFIHAPARGSVRLSCFNLHGSLLPELRGAAPVNWAIIRGLRETGVTTFELVDRMDAGPIYLQEATGIDPGETAEELKARLAEVGAQLVCRTLGLLAGGWAQTTEQDESRATRAPRLAKSDGVIRWSLPARQVCNLVHGTWPWPGAQSVFVHADGKHTPVTIARAAAADAGTDLDSGCLDEQLRVATGAGRLAILQIKPAGKRLMEWKDFVNGYRVTSGGRFVTPEAQR
jgi:methionyl-tRNA formyltransferase